ncbi:MAG: MFS transporter [Planctomycetota bacterium]
MDRKLLYAATFLRSLSTSAVGILIGIYCARLSLSPEQMGFIVGAGLVGNALAALLATVAGDRIGRRTFLAVLALLGAGGLGAIATRSDPWLLAAAAFVGMVNGVGRERGASVVLEQAIVPGLASDKERTQLFAWYNFLGDLGHGLGAAVAMLPALFRWMRSDMPSYIGPWELLNAHGVEFTLALCAVMTLGTLPLSLMLSANVERPSGSSIFALSPHTKRVVAKLSALFSLDALGGGFVTTAWLSWFFLNHFKVDETAIGLLFIGARVLNAFSHLVAAWLAKKIGLVNTMVFTHIPSSLFLVTVLFAPNFTIAAVLFLLREGLGQMDVPTRQSYVMAIVQPEERTAVAGITMLVRLGAWAVAPFAAGFLMKHVSIGTPVVIGAGLKILYDVLLWIAFRRNPPPEERASAGP